MKAITINVSESVYKDFQEYAKKNDRKTAELIREAMEDYRRRKIIHQTSLTTIQPVSVGKVLKEVSPDDDIF